MVEAITTQTGHNVYSMTYIGNIQRENNEDVAHHDWLRTAGGRELMLAVVCDGVGGGDVGEIAARRSTNAVVSYIEQSQTEPLADVLDGAIRYANQEVYNFFQNTPGRSGNATVSIACVDLNDGEYGRLYIGSVGDSPIYVVREPDQKNGPRELLRLNIDHNVMTEKIIFDGMSPDQARYVDHAEALTRAIGVGPDINPDTGMYIEVNGRMVSPQKAQALGRNGMPLERGDTVYVASDGLFDVSQADGQWFTPAEEFLRLSPDLSAERTTKELMDIARGREPYDNIALATIFVPSPWRHHVGGAGIAGLDPKARTALIAGVSLLFLVVVGAVIYAFFLGQDLTAAEQTQVAIAAERENLQATLQRNQTIQAYTPTPSNTPTPTNTPPPPTPLPTATSRPANVSADQVGFQSFERNFDSTNFGAENAVRERVPFTSQDQVSYVSIDGGADVPQPANLYLQPQTRLEVDRVENGSNLLDLIFYGSSSNLFMQTGQYAVGGVRVVLDENRNIEFETNGSCLAAGYISPQQVAFTCYSGESAQDCRYRLGGETGTLNIGERMVVNIQQENPSDTQMVGSEDDMTLRYYRTIESIVGAGGENPDSWSCLQTYIDSDLDTVIDQDDICPDETGNVNGCPDPDGDELVGNQDACPFTAGPASQAGCPDTDGDGFLDNVDACITQPGVDPNGCPDIDGDGFTDDVDACPSSAGVAPDGCPDSSQNLGGGDMDGPDMDGDTVPDDMDACIDEPGPVARNGCPRDNVSG